jgi:tetratricopeptide (TPR) repeat protein
MSRKRRSRVEAFEDHIERVLNPGAFIADRASFSFVSGLEELAAEIGKLSESDPARGVALYEAFLAGCYAKAEEIDDSSGIFGQFVQALFCRWISARERDGADAEETALRLMGWMDDDPYGFCYRLEKEAGKVLSKKGLAAFIKQIRARYDGLAPVNPRTGGGIREEAEYRRRRWSEALRALFILQKDVEAYMALALESGVNEEDCLAIASLYQAKRKPLEALAWVERGFGLDKEAFYGSSSGFGLAKLKRELLVKLGRSEEALDDAWDRFREYPSLFAYEDLMRFVPKSERKIWHAKAIEAAKEADLYSLLELLLKTKEIDRIADLLSKTKDGALEELSHFIADPVAKVLARTRPRHAARLWRAQGVRILNAKKSRAYPAALSYFENAKHSFERAGLGDEWMKTVNRVRADHHRKASFMPGFEKLVSGVGSGSEPSFLERAKARWDEDHWRDE